MPVQVAVVGLGRMGQQHAVAFRDTDSANIVAGVDFDETARRQFQAETKLPTYATVQDVIDDMPVDAVSIATPHDVHFEQAREALRAGVDTFVEKPLTIDPDHAEELVLAARENDCALGVGYQRRFLDTVQELKRIVSEHQIGVPQMVNCRIAQDWYPGSLDSWRGDADRSGGGVIFDTGSHLLEEILWILDAVPLEVAATVDQRGSDVDINSALSLTVATPAGEAIISTGICGESTDLASDESISIWGREGRVHYDSDVRRDPPASIRVVYSDRPSYDTTLRNVSNGNPTKRKLQAFITAIRGNEAPPVSGEAGIVLSELRNAIKESTENKSVVDIEGRLLARSVFDDVSEMRI